MSLIDLCCMERWIIVIAVEFIQLDRHDRVADEKREQCVDCWKTPRNILNQCHRHSHAF